MRDAMESLLLKYNVDIVFAGHVHAYERVHRVYQSKLNPNAPVYINIGDGGNREGLATQYYTPAPVWSAFRQAEYGHGELRVLNTTHVHWSWQRDPDSESMKSDEVYIVKGQQV